mgnify:CR=1 FL=1
MWIVWIWLALCAWQDARDQRISNALTLPVMVLAILTMMVKGQTLAGFSSLMGIYGAALALMLTLPGFILGRLGGGDVKLLLALGLSTHPMLLLNGFIYASIFLACWAWLQGQARAEHAFAPSILLGSACGVAFPISDLFIS